MWTVCAWLIVQQNKAHFVAYDHLDKAFSTFYFGNYKQFFIKNVTDGTRTDFMQFTQINKLLVKTKGKENNKGIKQRNKTSNWSVSVSLDQVDGLPV